MPKTPRAKLLAPSPNYDAAIDASECARPDLVWMVTGRRALGEREARQRPGSSWMAFGVATGTALAAVAAALWTVLT